MAAPIPSGFKNREEYNQYMQKYNQEYRLRKAKQELNTLLSHVNLSAEDSERVQKLISEEKFFEARNLVLFVLNQVREKNQFAIQQEKQDLINKYLRSDPEYQAMSQEGQHYWDLLLSKHLDLLITVITQGQFLIRAADSPHYEKLKINAIETRDKLEMDMMNDLMQFLAAKMNANPANLKHAPKFNIPEIKIEPQLPKIEHTQVQVTVEGKEQDKHE